MGLADFFDFCEKYGITAAVIILLGFAAAALFFPIFKDKFLYKFRHKRNRWYFLFTIGYAIIGLLLFKLNLTTSKWLAVLMALDVVYFIICVYTMDHELPYAHHMLRKYERFLEDGLASEHIDYFESKHWYISEPVEKIAYARLKGRYYADIGQVKKAYDAFCEINIDLMYDKEEKDFTIMKAMMLWEMGDFSAAAKLLESSVYDGHPVKHMLLSFISEYGGNLDDAYGKMKVAKDLCGTAKVDRVYQIQVLENFGRIQLFRGNYLEAEQYMLQADKLLGELKNPRADLQKNVKQNLIHVEAIMRGDTPYVRGLIEDYKNQLPANSIGNLIAYNNCCVEFYRQVNDTKAAYECIKTGYSQLIGKLDRTQKCLFQASTFRMLINGEYKHDWLDPEIENTYTEYANLSLPDKILVYKEFFGVFHQAKFYSLRKKAPYRKLWEQIKKYYMGSAVSDIDAYLVSLDAHEIYQRSRLIQDKLAILKYLQRDKHIAKSKQLYIDLYNMLKDAGLQIDAVNALMILIDECGSASNVKIQLNPFMRPINYQDYLDRLPPGPEPLPLEDGYQLVYASYMPRAYKVYPQQVPLMEEQLKIVIPIVKSWKNHPVKYEYSLHLAHFLMALGRKDEAKEFFDDFENSGISIEHYADWMREDYIFMKAEFETDKASSGNGSSS